MGGEKQPEKGNVINLFANQVPAEHLDTVEPLSIAFEYDDTRQAMAALLRHIYPHKEIDIDKLY